MNWMLAPTLLVSSFLGLIAFRLQVRRSRWWLWPVSGSAAIPALAYAGYYLHLVDEPILLYSLRSAAYSELLAGGIGLVAGLVIAWSRSQAPFVRWSAAGLTLLIVSGILLVPYLKPLLRPADWGAFSDKRQGVAVMQTTPYSCGPATAATLLNALGTSATELDIARQAHTSASGTENWYLARAIRNRGHSARFERSTAIVTSSIAGVTGGGYGHYIAVVSHDAGDYLVVDPLVGERRMTAEELTNRYDFTGFYLVVE